MSKFKLFLPLFLLVASVANAAINMSVTGIGSQGLNCFGTTYTNPTVVQIFGPGQQTVANPNFAGNFQVDDSYKGKLLTIGATFDFCSNTCGFDSGCLRQCELGITGQGTAKEGGVIVVRCNG